MYKRQKVLDTTLRKTLGVSCMFMWIILAALTFGAVFDGLGAGRAIETLFIERWQLSPWGVLIHQIKHETFYKDHLQCLTLRS